MTDSGSLTGLIRVTTTLTADLVAAAVESQGLGVAQECWQLDAGWESTIWAVLTSDRRLAVRVYAAAGKGDVAGREAKKMTALATAGYPVPRVHAVNSTLSLLGRPFLVMDLIDGRTLWDQRRRGLDQASGLCADLLAKLHGLNPKRFEMPALDRAALLTALADSVVRVPFLSGVVGWLEERIEIRKLVPCHMDLHPGNILIDGAGNHSVIDWTSFALSDLRLDTGWPARRDVRAARVHASFRDGLRGSHRGLGGRPCARRAGGGAPGR